MLASPPFDILPDVMTFQSENSGTMSICCLPDWQFYQKYADTAISMFGHGLPTPKPEDSTTKRIITLAQKPIAERFSFLLLHNSAIPVFQSSVP